MIRITGVAGEGAGELTNIAIEQLLKDHPQCLCFLIDDTSEFLPLVNKLNGINIIVSWKTESRYKEYTQSIISQLDNENFFRFTFDMPCEYELENIERFSRELEKKYNRKVYIIQKLCNVERDKYGREY